MFGKLLGGFFLGYIGDIYGRRVAYFLAVIFLLLGDIVGLLSPIYIVFLVARFIVGLGDVAIIGIYFVLGNFHLFIFCTF